ncbi:MAG: C25 family cysteine peptidase [Caldilineaceae bacterium]
MLVEQDAAASAAYADWLAVLADNASTNTQKNDAANNVASAVRNIVLSFSASAPQLQYVVLVGDDRVIPFRRIVEGELSDREEEYAPDVSQDTTIQAALAENMILTDDYFVDIEPSQWKGNDLFLPDYAIGRLIETPDEILTSIDTFLADPVNEVSNVLITGYDFMQDSANVINTLYSNDTLTTDAVLIGSVWPGDQLRQRQLNSVVQFNVQAINGHSTHVATGAPDENDIQAAEVLSASASFSGTLVFAVGCHAGLNDPGVLDLPQAFVSRGAYYVGNTGFGWGGGGVVLSESLMRNYAIELVRNTSAEIGPALVAAKQRYWNTAFVIGAYDAKILMQSTLYGLPMAEVTSGGTLDDDDPFPSADTTIQPPTSFGSVSKGAFNYGLPGSFGAFGESDTSNGNIFDLDQNTYFAAGAPVQPHFYANVEASAAGTFRGTIFRGGVYSDVTNFDPVVGLPYNEYVDDTTEPTFNQPGWFPTVPFAMGGGDRTQSGNTVVLSLGQFDSNSNTQRIFGDMSLDTLYSLSADQVKPEVRFVDGVLDQNVGKGLIKVEGVDDSGVSQVVVAFTDNLLNGQGEWFSADLSLDVASQKWTGEITGTLQTVYFVQVVDTGGNITVDDNKGRYYSLQSPLPLAQGTTTESRLYLPAISRP